MTPYPLCNFLALLLGGGLLRFMARSEPVVALRGRLESSLLACGPRGCCLAVFWHFERYRRRS
jgi:hypothetical protein